MKRTVCSFVDLPDPLWCIGPGITEEYLLAMLVDCFPGTSVYTQEEYLMQELVPDVAYLAAHFHNKERQEN